jgi:histidine ammonia-lyase
MLDAPRAPYTDSLWRRVRSAVPTYRDDRPLAEDMALAFRIIADTAPPPLPDPGKMRPATVGTGADTAYPPVAGASPAAPTTVAIAACDLQSAA